jgi:amidophosphoribosyltransferase
MCGIIAIISKENAAHDLFEGLYHLQHRGQDSFGISLVDKNNKLTIIKKEGLLLNSDIINLKGNIGIGHVRYPTKGAKNNTNCQPFIIHGTKHTISFVHNGQINKSLKLLTYIISNELDISNIDEVSDSYILAKIFLHILDQNELSNAHIYQSLEKLYGIVDGAFNCLVLIKNYGLVCFKDSHGFRPLILAKSEDKYMIASESVCADSLNYTVVDDIMNGECLIYHNDEMEKSIIKQKILKPCIFEYIYLARAESRIYNVSVYEARQRMGYYLSQKIKKIIDISNIDCVVPVPDTSKPCAQMISRELNIPYHEILIKNRYMSRTFIMNNQESRKKNIKRKFGVVKHYVKGKNLLIIDDSIVRGNTIGYIIDLLKKSGVGRLYIASCSPPVRYNNIHGIDIPDTSNLIANKMSIDQMKNYYKIDELIYQDLDDLKRSITDINPKLTHFETQVFDGHIQTK